MFKNITLEMSLKPFKQTDSEYIKKVITNVFEQWKPLLKNRRVISIMLWTADGSEILDYSGNLDDTFEWCKFMGTANKPMISDAEPAWTSLHAKKRYYMDNPPEMTYRILKEIIDAIKSVGKKYFPDSEIQVGETFDIGPEFSISDFKYNRHTEICTGSAGMGTNTFINSYGILKGDSHHYAGYPDGIPDNTPFGSFLGRQTKFFMRDLNFDFLWLSNGVGFCAESWNATGEIFDGEKFYPEKVDDVRERIFSFWKLFREECPDIPVQTRGTNFSAGIDFASDAVPLYDIYNADLNITPPPNSPWAALDGNFGIELMGHMTRVCELPGEEFMFRYYIHDPWWVNTPWYDRYEGQPHDIYMPMALSRIDEAGKVHSAGIFNILSIDNTWGNLPDSCVNEPLPHILKAEKDAADEPAPIVWVYPLREYTTTRDSGKLYAMMSGDWFVSGAINNGFPLSCVVSCDNFLKNNKEIYKKSILFTPVPDSGSEFERDILDYAKDGGKIIFYGSVSKASKEFLDMFALSLSESISNIMPIDKKYFPDIHKDEKYPEKINVRPLYSNGGIDTSGSGIQVMDKTISAKYKNASWYRASVSAGKPVGGRHLNVDNKDEFVLSEILLRNILADYGYSIKFVKPTSDMRTPVIMLNRSDNALMFSTYSPNTTVETAIKFPLGAPILLGYETEIKEGAASYRFPRAEHRECRIFVEQDSGIVGAKEIPPVNYQYRRKIHITGLENATVRFFGEEYCKEAVFATLNADNPWDVSDKFDWEIVKSPEYGTYFEAKNVTGDLRLFLPLAEFVD